MTLFQYLDSRFKDLSVDIQKDFSIVKDGEIKAVYAIIQWQRSFFKWASIPLILIRYLWACFFPDPPEAPPVESAAPETNPLN